MAGLPVQTQVQPEALGAGPRTFGGGFADGDSDRAHGDLAADPPRPAPARKAGSALNPGGCDARAIVPSGKMCAARRWCVKDLINQTRNGAVGWGLLWLLGIPIPVLVVLFLLRGCT